MNTKNLFLLCLIFATSFSFSQIKVSGIVRDSIGNPLELANVIALNQNTKKMDSYGVSNEEGKYNLSLDKHTLYKIKVSYIGMETSEVELNTSDQDIVKNFELKTDNELDAVQLVYEMPVVVKGDTIVYNADSFTSGTERKLGDVLKKLPGVEVNEDGQVEVEGKTVSKLMVEGNDFFDGDSKLATKSIPANAVDKVEVLKNFSSVGQLSSVTNNQDNIAINIKLKEGKKNFWFGDIASGLGSSNNDELYLLQPKLFYYSPKYSVNIIGDLNNIGELAFTRRDYYNFTGGFRMPSSQSGTNISLGDNTLGLLALQNNRAKDINTKFGAVNFSYSPRSSLDISGFAIFSNSKTELQDKNEITYTNPSLEIPNENTESIVNQKSNLGMFKLSAKYIPNSNNQLDYDVLSRVSEESQEQALFSSVNGNINEFENSKPFSINQSLNYYYTLNDTNIFAFEGQHLLQDEDPFYKAVLEDKSNYLSTAITLGLNNLQTDYNIAQKKRVKSNQLDVKLDYWNILNPKSNINFALGNIFSKQNFNSNLFQTLDDSNTFNPTLPFNNGLNSNNISYVFNDIYLGFQYRLKTGIFTFSPGFSSHFYNTKNSQFGQSLTDNFFRVLPDFNIRIQLKKSEQITLSYGMQTQFTDVNQLAKGVILNNYSYVFYGNPELESAILQNFNLFYYSFNLFNYTNVTVNLNYNKTIDRIRRSSNFAAGNVISFGTPINTNFADESFNASGNFEKTLGKFRGTLESSFGYFKFNQFINNINAENEIYSQSYRPKVRSNFKKAPNFEIGYNYLIQANNQAGRKTKFYTKEPSINIDALIKKALTLKTNFTYTKFSNQSRLLNDYKFWDASLSYRKNKDSKWEYEIKGTNLLNTKSQNTSNSNSVWVSNSQYFIQPRFVTFRIRYEI